MRIAPARRRALAAGVVLTTMIGSAALFAGPAEAREITQADLDAAASAEQSAAAALDAAEAALAQATAERDRYRATLERIATRQDSLVGEQAQAAATVRDRVARMYMVAGAGEVRSAVDDSGRFATRIAYLTAIADSDRRLLNGFAFTEVDLATVEAEARRGIDEADRQISERTAVVTARTADLADATSRRSTLEAEWRRQEEARKAALEAQLRAQEEALAAAATTTTTVAATTTTDPDTYGWDPKGGVEQWRPLVTRVFTEWGLDKEKCGPKGCVGPQIENALVIMRCESDGIPFATNGPDTEWGVVGLYQHRKIFWADRVARARARGFSALPADATPWNPEHNVIVAALLVWESRETLIGNLNYGRPWSDGPEPWGHWDGSSRYCASPPLVSP
jgi:hypothetical protein